MVCLIGMVNTALSGQDIMLTTELFALGLDCFSPAPNETAFGESRIGRVLFLCRGALKHSSVPKWGGDPI